FPGLPDPGGNIEEGLIAGREIQHPRCGSLDELSGVNDLHIDWHLSLRLSSPPLPSSHPLTIAIGYEHRGETSPLVPALEVLRRVRRAVEDLDLRPAVDSVRQRDSEHVAEGREGVLGPHVTLFDPREIEVPSNP